MNENRFMESRYEHNSYLTDQIIKTSFNATNEATHIFVNSMIVSIELVSNTSDTFVFS